MPTTMTIAHDLVNSPPRNVITIAGSTSDSGTLTRTDADGVQRPVRGGDPGVLASGGNIFYDYEVPYLNSCVYNFAPAAGGLLAKPVLGLAVRTPWLVHPGIPDLSLPVNRLTFTDRETDSGAVGHDVLGAVFPIMISDGVRKAGSYQLGLQTDTADEYAAMAAILSTTDTLLLQVVYPFSDVTMWQYLDFGHAVDSRVSMRWGDARRNWTIDVTEQDRPTGGIAPQLTIADIAADNATIRSLSLRYKTITGMLEQVDGA